MIVFDEVTKRYAGGVIAVDDLSLEARSGQLTVIVGHCGRTTSLRMIYRLITPLSGVIILGGEPKDRMEGARPRRPIGYVIQHDGLFPRHTVVQTIASTARLNGVAKVEALRTAHDGRTVQRGRSRRARPASGRVPAVAA